MKVSDDKLLSNRLLDHREVSFEERGTPFERDRERLGDLESLNSASISFLEDAELT